MSAHYYMLIINQILMKNDIQRPVLLLYSVNFLVDLQLRFGSLVLDVVVIVPTYVCITKNFSYVTQTSFVRFEGKLYRIGNFRQALYIFRDRIFDLSS